MFLNKEFKSLKKDDEKYDQLNIAWDKYKIDPNIVQTTPVKYDFYCALCNKSMQRKAQLVDVILIEPIIFKPLHYFISKL